MHHLIFFLIAYWETFSLMQSFNEKTNWSAEETQAILATNCCCAWQLFSLGLQTGFSDEDMELDLAIVIESFPVFWNLGYFWLCFAISLQNCSCSQKHDQFSLWQDVLSRAIQMKGLDCSRPWDLFLKQTLVVSWQLLVNFHQTPYDWDPNNWHLLVSGFSFAFSLGLYFLTAQKWCLLRGRTLLKVNWICPALLLDFSVLVRSWIKTSICWMLEGTKGRSFRDRESCYSQRMWTDCGCQPGVSDRTQVVPKASCHADCTPAQRLSASSAVVSGERIIQLVHIAQQLLFTIHHCCCNLWGFQSSPSNSLCVSTSTFPKLDTLEAGEDFCMSWKTRSRPRGLYIPVQNMRFGEKKKKAVHLIVAFHILSNRVLPTEDGVALQFIKWVFKASNRKWDRGKHISPFEF